MDAYVSEQRLIVKPKGLWVFVIGFMAGMPDRLLCDRQSDPEPVSLVE